MKAQTYVGIIQLRTDLKPAYGQTVDGKYRVCLNLVPDNTFGDLRMHGSYKYWRVPIYEGAERKAHDWQYFDSMRTEKWQTAEPRDGNICFPQQLEWGLEQVAREFDCDVWIDFRTEFLDPEQPADRVTCIVIHLFGLEEVTDLNHFVQTVASRINREAKRWARESVHWSLECV